MKKIDFALSWDNELYRWLLAFVLAVLAWMVVTMNYDKNTSSEMTAEVDFTYRATGYTNLGLDIVNQPEKTVRVKFEGSGTLLGEMRTSDFVVYPDYSAIRGAGDTTLNLLVEMTNSRYSSVKATIIDNNRTVNVVFDTVGEKTLPITVTAANVSTAEGYLLNRTVANPVEVTIRGPESEIEKITKVVANVTSDETHLTGSVTVPTVLEPQDSDGDPVSLHYATMSITSTEVMLVVHQVRELPLSVNFINVPNGFDLEQLHYSLDHETMKVVGPEKALSELEAISIASFDLSAFELDRAYPLAVELPAGITGQDGITAVTLSFSTEGWTEKVVNAENIRIVNPIKGLEIEPVTEKINEVHLVGPAEVLESLTGAQVVARINADDITVSEGQQTVPVRIVIPSSNQVLAIGSYTVTCQVN